MNYNPTKFERELLLQKYLSISELSLADIEGIRLLLRGDSVIDWHRLCFENADQVDNFLRVNMFDPKSIEDQRRLRYFYQESMQYLKNHFNIIFPDIFLELSDIQSIFLYASVSSPEYEPIQPMACAILKVMSILHHIEGRSLLFRTPISDLELFSLIQERIDTFYEAAQNNGIPIVHIYGSRKSRDSLITKLLSKRDTIAATIFDKLRYRVIVENYSDIVPVLAYMSRVFIPYNYCIPNESVNTLVSMSDLLNEWGYLHYKMDGVASNYTLNSDDLANASNIQVGNSFSGSSYRVLNFIVDLPIRLDPFLTKDDMAKYGCIGFILLEFQLVDQNTDDENELGENSHQLYKNRQKQKVLDRLKWGSIK